MCKSLWYGDQCQCYESNIIMTYVYIGVISIFIILLLALIHFICRSKRECDVLERKRKLQSKPPLYPRFHNDSMRKPPKLQPKTVPHSSSPAPVMWTNVSQIIQNNPLYSSEICIQSQPDKLMRPNEGVKRQSSFMTREEMEEYDHLDHHKPHNDLSATYSVRTTFNICVV